MLVKFQPAATFELQHAFDWYEKRSVYTASPFKVRVSRAIVSPCQRPSSAGFPITQRARKILLTPFGYGLIYFATDYRVYVVAIAHDRCKPRYWQLPLAAL